MLPLGAAPIAISSSGGSWHDPTAWDLGVIPNNNATDTYLVSISGFLDFDLDDLTEVDSIAIGPGGTLNLASGIPPRTLYTDGLTVNGGLYLSPGSYLSFLTLNSMSGTVLDGGGVYYIAGLLEACGCLLVTENAATITLTATGLFTNGLGFGVLETLETNSGSLTLAGHSLQVTGDLSNTGFLSIDGGELFTGGLLQNSGMLMVSGVLNSDLQQMAGSLTGSGTISGNAVIDGGTVSPGNSPGTLTIQGDFTAGPGATYLVDIEGTAPGFFDTLFIQGSGLFGGLLDINLGLGFLPNIGDSFRIASCGVSCSGMFSITTPGWMQEYRNGELFLVFTDVPEPGSAVLVGLGMLGAWLARNIRRTI